MTTGCLIFAEHDRNQSAEHEDDDETQQQREKVLLCCGLSGQTR